MADCHLRQQMMQAMAILTLQRVTKIIRTDIQLGGWFFYSR
jgi:hypothetical protein